MDTAPIDAHAATLDYGLADSASHTRKAAQAMMAFFIVFAGFVHFASFTVSATCVTEWRAMGSKLPAITMLLAETCQWIALGWGWTALWCAAIGAPFLIGRVYPQWPREHNGAYLLLALALALVIVMTFLLMAIVAPMMTILAPINTVGRK